MSQHATTPRPPLGLVVAGLAGGSGKSVVSVGLTAALAARGLRVVPFKKGPDYIDAGWLSLAAGRDCHNLDPYLMEPPVVLDSFSRQAAGGDIVVVEGNRGLFDGVDAAGSYSTAELAVQLRLPVLLVVDCTKTTRTVAAMVLGCLRLDDKVRIAGVVANRIAGDRHLSIVREAVERYAGVPVVGALPKMKREAFPQRHLGVIPFQEHAGAGAAVAELARLAEEHLDLDRILGLMEEAGLVKDDGRQLPRPPATEQRVRIGVIRDAAFQFYYPENLAALSEAGAELVEINALTAAELPEVDGLYIGGGFPETSARQLADNTSFRMSVRQAAARGLPIYAECGGLIYLGESISLDGEVFPLAGVFPVRFELSRKPQAHGYTVFTVDRDTPFYRKGETVRGHEFRYSRVVDWRGEVGDLALSMQRGVGFAGGRDGLVRRNTLALYTHIHALGTPQWAPAMVARALAHRAQGSGIEDL
ncbi:MAG: cobyrinate a,c-diamide synthase [Thermodesulfobacteriota bacterium]